MQERLLLWEKYWPANLMAADKVSLKELVGRYELMAAGIVNVFQLSVLRTLACGQTTIDATTLVDVTRLEYQKEGTLIG